MRAGEAIPTLTNPPGPHMPPERRDRRAHGRPPTNPATEANVNITGLETFAWIARLGSFVAAADRLSATECALARSIDGLEKEMGVSLFEPDPRSARLTAKGHELVPYAERVIALTAEIRRRIATPTILAGVARVGAGELIAMTWMSKLAQAVNEKHPQVRLEITLGAPSELTDKVLNGDLDVALVPGPVIDPNLTSRSLGEVEFRWMASPQLDIPEGDMTPCILECNDLGCALWTAKTVVSPGRALTPNQLATLPIIGCSQQSHRYRSVEQWFCAADAGYRFVTDCDNLRAVIALTIAGQGVSRLPLIACREYVRNGSLCILKTHPTMPKGEFFAVSPGRGSHPMADALTPLAMQASTFSADRASR